jgi:hypothetical protein
MPCSPKDSEHPWNEIDWEMREMRDKRANLPRIKTGGNRYHVDALRLSTHYASTFGWAPLMMRGVISSVLKLS